MCADYKNMKNTKSISSYFNYGWFYYRYAIISYGVFNIVTDVKMPTSS